jgi:hypothetical protein
VHDGRADRIRRGAVPGTRKIGTVDDCDGQELAREAERAGRLVDDVGGDVEEAEVRFDEGDTAVGQRP